MFTTVLLFIIKILLLILVGTWITIGVSLLYRSRRTRYLLKIESTFAEITSHYLYPQPEHPFDLVKANRSLRELGIHPKNPGNVQYLIDLMIRTQRSLLGRNYEKLEMFYKQIPPYRVSLNKLQSKKWHIKARGIREIYEMDQKQYLKEVIREINHDNIYVRREAQIAIVVFLGWESFRFLPYLKREMTLWQQIKVVEKLHDLYPIANLKYLKKAYHTEKQYATELIMRIIRKFELVDEVDYIIRFLDSPNFDTRETAIYCISSFHLTEKQLVRLKYKFMNIRNVEQQVQLLKYINRVSTHVDVPFYKLLLYTGNDIIRLCSAEILWSHECRKEVEDFYYQQYASQPQPA